MNVAFYVSKSVRLTIKSRESGVRYILMERINEEKKDVRIELSFREIAYMQSHPLQFDIKGQEWISFWDIIPRIILLMVEGVMSFPLLPPQMAPMRPSHRPIKYVHEEHALNLSKYILRVEPSVVGEM